MSQWYPKIVGIRTDWSTEIVQTIKEQTHQDIHCLPLILLLLDELLHNKSLNFKICTESFPGVPLLGYLRIIVY